MNRAYRALFAGMLSIVFTGTAIAHDPYGGSWSGGVSVAVTPHGDLAWSGGLSYGAAVTYPVRHVVAVPVHDYGPVCGHPSHRRHVAHGKRHKHWKRHHHARPYRH